MNANSMHNTYSGNRLKLWIYVENKYSQILSPVNLVQFSVGISDGRVYIVTRILVSAPLLAWSKIENVSMFVSCPW